MKRLLSASQKRQLELTEYLFYNKDFIHINKLAKLLNSSERIIKNDLSIIKKNFPMLKIKSSFEGVSLHIPPNIGITIVYRFFLENSQYFQIMEYIFFNNKCTTEDIMDNLYISPSSLYRNISKINSILNEKFNIKIEKSPYTITGDEKEIRYFFSQYFAERYNPLYWPFDNIEEESFENLIKYFTDFTKIDLNFANFRYIKLTTAVNLIRFQSENYLQIEEKENIRELYDSIMNFYEKDTKFIQYCINLNIQPSFELFSQLFIAFVQKHFYFSYDDLVLASKNNILVEESINLLQNIFSEIAIKFGFRLDNINDLVLNIHNTAFLDKYEIEAYYILYNKKKYPIEVVSSLYPKLFNLIKDRLFEYQIKINGYSNEEILNHLIYTLLTHWEKLFIEIFLKLPTIKAVVISEFDIYHSKSICDTLNYYIPNNFIAEPYKKHRISVDDLSDSEYDIIIANFNLPEIKNKIFLYLDKVVDYDFVQKLRNHIQKLSIEKREI